MNESKTNGIFVNALKAFFNNLLKMLAILFAWLMKGIGLFLSRLGEAIERIIIKRSSL